MMMMKKIDIINLMIDRGFTYDKTTGKIYGVRGIECKIKHNAGYILLSIRKDNKLYFALGHQFAFVYENGHLPEIIDHINTIRDDNRIENLREANYSINNFNRSGVKGYTFDKSRNKWRVRVGEKFIGRFNTEDEAHNAYIQAKKLY